MLSKNEILKRYNVYLKTGTLRKTAAQFNISYQALSLLFNYHNLPMNSSGKRIIISEKNKLKILDMAKTDNINVIAKKLRIGWNIVKKILLLNKIKPVKNRKHKLTTMEEQQVCIDYKQLGMIALSSKYRVAVGTIKYILKKNNIQMRTKGRLKIVK